MYRYILYNRTSTSHQERNASRPHQFEAGKAFGDALGGLFVKEVYDNVSGATLERAGIDEALRLLEEGKADLVIAWDVTRTGRDAHLLKDFYRNIYQLGGKLGLSSKQQVYKTIDDALIETHWERSVSEYERLQTLRRTNNGKRVKMKLGGWLNTVIYGYKLVTTRCEGVNIRVPEIVEFEANLVRRILLDYTNGETFADITTKLNEQAVPTARGLTYWHIGTVVGFVNNAALYAGQPFERSITIDGAKHTATYAYPPIISSEEYAQLAVKRQIEPRARAQGEIPFSGILFCSHCGAQAGRVARRTRKDGSQNSVLQCATGNKAATYTRLKRPVGEDSCRGKVYSTTLRDFLVETLSRNGDLHPRLEHGVADYRAALEMNRKRRAELAAQRQVKLERKGVVLERLLEMGDVEDLYMLLEKVKTEVDDLSRLIAELDAVIHQQEAVVSRYSLAGAAKAQEKLAALERAAGDEDWDEVNTLMAQLGLKLTVDFNAPNPKARRKSFDVVIDGEEMWVKAASDGEKVVYGGKEGSPQRYPQLPPLHAILQLAWGRGLLAA